MWRSKPNASSLFRARKTEVIVEMISLTIGARALGFDRDSWLIVWDNIGPHSMKMLTFSLLQSHIRPVKHCATYSDEHCRVSQRSETGTSSRRSFNAQTQERLSASQAATEKARESEVRTSKAPAASLKPDGFSLSRNQNRIDLSFSASVDTRDKKPSPVDDEKERSWKSSGMNWSERERKVSFICDVDKPSNVLNDLLMKDWYWTSGLSFKTNARARIGTNNSRRTSASLGEKQSVNHQNKPLKYDCQANRTLACSAKRWRDASKPVRFCAQIKVGIMWRLFSLKKARRWSVALQAWTTRMNYFVRTRYLLGKPVFGWEPRTRSICRPVTEDQWGTQRKALFLFEGQSRSATSTRLSRFRQLIVGTSLTLW